MARWKGWEGQGRHEQLLNDLKETRKYWKSKEEAWDCTVWRTHFGRDWTCHETAYVMMNAAEWSKNIFFTSIPHLVHAWYYCKLQKCDIFFSIFPSAVILLGILCVWSWDSK
jgi:hypothetical protein